MSRRTLISLLVLLLVVVLIVWFTRNKNSSTATPDLSISVFNQTKNTDATSVNASPGDLLSYTLTAANSSGSVIPGYIMEVSISGIADKTTLVDASGASFNSTTNSLVWTPNDIPANGSINKQFAVKVNPQPTGTTSTLTVKFNNQVDVSLVAPTTSIASKPTTAGERTYKAPVTGSNAALPGILALTALAGFIGFRKLGIT